jgi:hypothetical protein
MMTLRKPLFFLALCGLLMVIATNVVTAATVEVRVSRTDPACAQPACFSTIQGAVTYVDSIVNGGTVTSNSYSVRVESGTYTEAITLKSNILIQGRETAKTVLFGSGSSSVITASGITNSTIANFTITSATTGVDISSSSFITLSNNIFNLTTGTGVIINTSSNLGIANNTFYQNKIAISSGVDIPVTNNIFSRNTTALDSRGGFGSFSQVTYNDFFSNGSNGLIVTSNTNTSLDPQFVDAVHTDFHLLPGSPCIGTGNLNNYPNIFDTATSDMGAYGGLHPDMIPYKVSGVAASVPSSTTISLSWSPNSSYLTKGYRVHYGTQSGVYDGTGAAEGPSPILVTAGTSTTLSSLPVSTIAPAAPALNPPGILNQSLDLSWPAVAGATMYRVYSSTSSFDETSLPATYDVTSTNSFRLTGLINGQTYYVAVKAIAQNTYYIAVTALDVLNTTPGYYEPGIKNESVYSTESVVNVGTAYESPISNVEAAFPEKLVPYPNLPNGNQGCFIATAAYGNYSSPEVRILREFRDRYLLTSGPGSAFVRWYYRHSPAAAAFLNAHPEYKPLIRAALTPAVGAALFMTRTSLPLKMGLLVITGCAIAFLISRKLPSGTGGNR